MTQPSNEVRQNLWPGTPNIVFFLMVLYSTSLYWK